MSVTPLSSFQEWNRRDNARYARGRFDRLMGDLGDDGVYERLEILVKELRSDGFSDAAFHARQALPLLRAAELHLERAKGKVS